ncbi:hypothetical protein M9H77_13244 [Catharanthus roseus]|uniref:Uncharacterized protein n=1 Tax=Catharanthus roseus TaxID=4058 RepID=A0ACC0BJP1_CATRO|nr:hypothetical protein M9H77_13244 [Catharanthus roseus]
MGNRTVYGRSLFANALGTIEHTGDGGNREAESHPTKDRSKAKHRPTVNGRFDLLSALGWQWFSSFGGRSLPRTVGPTLPLMLIYFSVGMASRHALSFYPCGISNPHIEDNSLFLVHYFNRVESGNRISVVIKG